MKPVTHKNKALRIKKNPKKYARILLFLFLALLFLLYGTDKKKSWTFAFYLAGENSLEREQIKNLAEIINGARGIKHTRIVIFIDTGETRNPFTQVRDSMLLESWGSISESVLKRLSPGLPSSIEKNRFHGLIQSILNKEDQAYLLTAYNATCRRLFLRKNSEGDFDANKTRRVLERCDYLLPLAYTKNLKAASAVTMQQFFSFVRDNYISDHYAYFISGHGNGWYPGDGEKSGDDSGPPGQTNLSSSIPEEPPQANEKIYGRKLPDEYYDAFDPFILKEALAFNEPDVLSLDMCLMADMETIYQLKNSTKYLIVSQTTIPASGQDYKLLLKNIKAHSSLAPSDLAGTIISTYRESFTNRQYTISTIAVEYGSNFDGFTKGFDAFTAGNGILDKLQLDPDDLARLPPWSPGKSDSMINIRQMLMSLNAKGLMTYFEDKNKRFIIDSFSNNEKYNGMSIFYPIGKSIYQKYRKDYDKLDLTRDFPGWRNIIQRANTTFVSTVQTLIRN